MSMDNTGFTGGSARMADSDPVTDAPLMGATPIWETRGKKRRGAARTAGAPAATVAASEPRSFETVTERPATQPVVETRPVGGFTPQPEPSFAATASVTDPMTGRPDMVETTDSGLVTPIARTRTARSTGARKGGMPAAAIAAGVVALGAVGAAGWYASQQNDGVAELTPGPAPVAQAPSAPLATAAAPAPMNMAATTPPPAAAPVVSETRAAPVRTAARARPAAAASAPSADQAGINASGTAEIPGGPQPYSALNPGAAPAEDAATVNPAPTPIPSTPPVLSVPAPAAATPAPATPAPVEATPPQ